MNARGAVQRNGQFTVQCFPYWLHTTWPCCTWPLRPTCRATRHGLIHRTAQRQHTCTLHEGGHLFLILFNFRTRGVATAIGQTRAGWCRYSRRRRAAPQTLHWCSSVLRCYPSPRQRVTRPATHFHPTAAANASRHTFWQSNLLTVHAITLSSNCTFVAPPRDWTDRSDTSAFHCFHYTVVTREWYPQYSTVFAKLPARNTTIIERSTFVTESRVRRSIHDNNIHDVNRLVYCSRWILQ